MRWVGLAKAGVLRQDTSILRQVPLRVCAKLNTQVIKIARQTE